VAKITINTKPRLELKPGVLVRHGDAVGMVVSVNYLSGYAKVFWFYGILISQVGCDALEPLVDSVTLTNEEPNHESND